MLIIILTYLDEIYQDEDIWIFLRYKKRRKEYQKLYRSMQKKGFDDRHPMDIMLCRNMGVKDTLNNGHHRMAVAMNLHLKRVSIMFSSAGVAPHGLRWFFMLIAKMNMFFKQLFREKKK